MPSEHHPWTDYHPVYLDLRGRNILIVGGGSIALEKLQSFVHENPSPCAGMFVPGGGGGAGVGVPPTEPIPVDSSSRSERGTSGERDLGPPRPGQLAEVPRKLGMTNGGREPGPGPHVTVVAPEVLPQISQWHADGVLTWLPREFRDADIADAYMVIAATDNPELNARVYALGDAANRLTNSVDDPAHCNFIMAAIGRQGPMQVAVSSAGCSPALAQRVRHRIVSEILTEEVGNLAAFLGERRLEVKHRLPGYKVRQAFWEQVIDLDIPDFLRRGDLERAERRFAEMLNAAVASAPGDFGGKKGKVYLVGAGPGDPELITLKAVRALQRADVVLYDRLVDPRLLNHAPPKAERIYVGKEARHGSTPLVAGGGMFRQQEINNLMIDYAAKGRTVVRLKGGDPFVFGRGGEEMLALHAAGVEFEVVPGVSSAIAAPAAAGIPVTHRGVATCFAAFAGHEAEGRDDVPWDVAAKIPTAVFLMGVERLPTIVSRLLAAGRDPDTPVAVISNATLPSQLSVTGILADIVARADGIPSPAVIVVGDVVAIPSNILSCDLESPPAPKPTEAEISLKSHLVASP